MHIFLNKYTGCEPKYGKLFFLLCAEYNIFTWVLKRIYDDKCASPLTQYKSKQIKLQKQNINGLGILNKIKP